MTKARRLEGPCAPLFYLVATLLLLSAKITVAQSVDLSSLEICANLETPELKLACFEAIGCGSRTTETRQSEAVDSPLSEQPVAEIEAVPEAEPPVEVMRQEAPAVDAAADSTPAAVATSTVAVTTEPAAATLSVTPEPSATTVATTPEAVANSQLGEEHLDRPETKANEDEVFHATVIEVTQGHNRILYFHFDNGQVWRQMEARHLEYPRSGEFDINITRGMMGDYRMRIGDDGRLVRIRRVK